MSPQQYLENKLKSSAKHILSSSEKANLEKIGLRDFLFQLITRKTFRRWKLPELARERIDKVLEFCLANKQLIIFRFRFGGYKFYQLKSAPEVDWAEFLSISYYLEYLAPIIAVYPYSVKLMYMLEDAGIEQMNNLSEYEMDSYCMSFKKLCDEFLKYAPENFSIEIIRHEMLFDSIEDFNREFQAKVTEIEKTWKENQTPAYLESILKTAELNIKWNGVIDLTKISEGERQKKIEQSAVMHDALVGLPTIRAFCDRNPRIILIFTTPLPRVISIGMTRASIVKFWMGSGVLEEKNETYLDHVVSPSQIIKIEKLQFKELPINLIDGKNFTTIKVYSEKLNFLEQ